MTTVPPALTRAMHDHWRVFIAEGVVLIVLGLMAIVVPPIAGLATTIVLGWLFLVAGILGVLATFGARRAPGFGWALLSALMALIAGVLLLWSPVQGLLTITYVLIAFFVADGVLTIFLALSHRAEVSGRWQLMLLNGVVDLILAGVIISGLPGSLAWALGLLVGIDLLFGGVSLVAIAFHARKSSLV